MISLTLSFIALALAAMILFRLWRFLRDIEALIDRIEVRDPYGSCTNAGDHP